MNGPWGNGRLERILVYGLGLSGCAAARFLLARGAAVIGVDRSDPAQLDLGDLAGRIELLARGEPAHLPAGVDLVVVSPGVPLDRPLLADARFQGVPVIAEVELAFPFLNGPVVAITGSNGKSTTTALAGHMLRAGGHAVEVCGNIGKPICDVIDGPAGRIFVVELSSFQIEGIETFRPRAAALLNLSEDHLDRYDGMAAYGAAKKRLFRDMGPDDVAVLNADDPETDDPAIQAHRRWFSRLRPVADGCASIAGGPVLESGANPSNPAEAPLFTPDQVPLAGVQNLENAMAAALLAREFGVAPEALQRALSTFEGLPHRLQRVGERDGVVWYDDSKGTNPGATMKSIEGFAPGTVHLILGGRNKGADLGALAPLVAEKARRLYLIGESAEDFERALGNAAPFEHAGTLERAVASAKSRARAGEVVVLSPACASFDQFRNYVDRGERYQGYVRAALGGPDGEEARL
jgi:UDP-N-acetylmuramoylalanine--D-glutamate ligase